MNILSEIKKELRKAADKEKVKILLRFFKTGKGEYGAGDKFLGIVMPRQREIAKKYFDRISLGDTLKLLRSKFHEERMTSLLLMMLKYKKGTPSEQKKIFLAYLANTKFINNWDLVDVTCRGIIGAYLLEKDRNILYKMVKSKNIWERRIAIVSTFYFISKNDLADTFKIAEMLLSDRHDLIHKAIGWSLREAGKKDKPRLIKFLNENISKMPRTTLRYSIEKFPATEREGFLKK